MLWESFLVVAQASEVIVAVTEKPFPDYFPSKVPQVGFWGGSGSCCLVFR